MKTLFRLVLLCLGFCAPAALAAESGPKVVVSIKPLHALATAVMEGVATPTLLLPGNASPHTITLRPSEALALSQADLIFWVGPGLERFLLRTLQGLDPGKGVALMEQEGMRLLPVRSSGLWAEDDRAPQRGEKHDHHDHGPLDPHVWLDPHNAMAMVTAMASALQRRDPSHAARYALNREATIQSLQALDQELATRLAAVKERPFLVFHDGFQYLEQRYQLTALGAVLSNPELPPGARRLMELRERIKSRGVRCVFSEPQFKTSAVNSIVEGTGAATRVLDYLGAAEPPGAGAYLAMMRKLGAELHGCLNQ